jgi:glycosyl hydrolase family 79
VPLHTWATEDRGTLRVTLINASARQSRVVAVGLPAPPTTATLERLTSPDLSARRGIALGGQSFGAATATGELGGTARPSLIHPIRGRFVVRMPPASAALLIAR